MSDNTTAKFRNDTGDCLGVMSQQCVRDIENATLKLYDPYSACRCPEIRDLNSCSYTERIYSLKIIYLKLLY
jgi:hypothetical protein